MLRGNASAVVKSVTAFAWLLLFFKEAASSTCIQGSACYQGFDGTPFDFVGYSGGIFNFLTERDHQINVYLEDFGTERQTYISAVGLKYKDKVKAFAASSPYRQGTVFKADNMTIELNDRPIHKIHDMLVFTDVHVEVQRKQAEDMLFMSTPQFSISISKAHNQLRLDLSVQARGQAAEPVHGILGQTVSWSTSPLPIIKRIQGDDFSYEVSGLFRDDFDHNLFGYSDMPN